MKSKIILIAGLTALLMYIPYVNVFFKVFNTLFHEGGHAIAALMMKGDVVSISLFANTEGITTTSSSSWISSFFTSIFGYVFASLVALLFAYFWKSHKHKTILWSVGLFSIVNLIFWVRNPYGIGWLIFSSLLIGLLLLKFRKENLLSAASLVITIVLVTQSLMSSIDILYLSYMTPEQAGDTTNLSVLTHLPSLFWGVFFFLQAFILSFLSFRLLWKTKELNTLTKRR